MKPTLDSVKSLYPCHPPYCATSSLHRNSFVVWGTLHRVHTLELPWLCCYKGQRMYKEMQLLWKVAFSRTIQKQQVPLTSATVEFGGKSPAIRGCTLTIASFRWEGRQGAGGGGKCKKEGEAEKGSGSEKEKCILSHMRRQRQKQHTLNTRPTAAGR